MMRCINWCEGFAGAFCALAMAPAAALAVSQYDVLDLGTLGGLESQAYDINNSGQIVGVAKNLLGADIAFRTAPLSPINPTTDSLGLMGGTKSYAYSINSAGTVVGEGNVPTDILYEYNDRAFRYDASMQDLGTLGGEWSYGYEINEMNQIVGGAGVRLPAAQTRAFLHSGGTMYNLGSLNSVDQNSWAHGINNNGKVVGYSGHSTINYWERHAFLWSPTTPNGTSGSMIDLGTFGGGYSYAWSINDNNQVVGGATLPLDIDFHAFLYENGGKTDLGTLGGIYSEAFDINGNSDIVGASTDASGISRAFLRTDGTMYDLNALLGGGSNWLLKEARAVNDLGQIVGWGINPDGLLRGFLLTPRPPQPKWNVDADGSWGEAANWLNGVPDGVGEVANFTDAITQPRTVTLSWPYTVGAMKFDNVNAYTLAGTGAITMDASSGNASINVATGSHTIATPLVLADTTEVSMAAGSVLTTQGISTTSGAGLIKQGGGELAVAHVRGGGLDVAEGRVTIAGAGTNGTSVVETLDVAGKLDLRDNKLIVTGEEIGSWDGSGYSGVIGLIASGRGDGSWNGASGIITSMSDAVAGDLTTLAVATADEVAYVGKTFGGQSVASGDVLIMYTWGGDADLDGDLDGDDYFRIDASATNSGGTFGYANGDFDYDGEIDGDDYFIIDSNIGVAQSSPPFAVTSAAGMSSVPEPGGAVLAAVAAAMAMRRRRAR